jgi:protein-tyrosine-phosphatase
MIIHFICRGNAFRSIIAEAYLNSLRLPDVQVRSSGTRARVNLVDNRQYYDGILDLLEWYGIRQYAKTHYGDDLTAERMDGTDIAICMNQLVYDEARAICAMPNLTMIWDVSDINGRGRIVRPGHARKQLEREAFREIKRDVDGMVRELKLKVPTRPGPTRN